MCVCVFERVVDTNEQVNILFVRAIQIPRLDTILSANQYDLAIEYYRAKQVVRPSLLKRV